MLQNWLKLAHTLQDNTAQCDSCGSQVTKNLGTVILCCCKHSLENQTQFENIVTKAKYRCKFNKQ